MIKAMRYLLLLSLILSLSACSLFRSQPEPQVSLVSIFPTSVRMFEQQYDVRLRIQNQGSKPLNISGLVFDLTLNGQSFAQGVSNQPVSIAAFSSGTVNVSVTSSVFSLIRQWKEMRAKDEMLMIDYALSGRLYRPDSMVNLSFQNQGQMNLKDFGW